MYNLKVTLVGCSAEMVPEAAREVLRRWAFLDVEYPNVTAVRKNVLVTESETRLFVFYVGSAYDLTELKRLNDLYPHCPILAVIDAAGDPTLTMKSLRIGALQVVHSPLQPDDLQEAVNCIAAKHRGLSKLAQLITVTSAVGGCGGTTVAIHLALELARRAKAHCILMELALRKGVLANHLDITPRYTTTDLVTDIDRIDGCILQGALTEVAENLSVLAGPYDSIQTESFGVDAVMKLVRRSAPGGWVIADVPGAYDDLFFGSLKEADRIVIVADQTVAAIRGAQMVCGTLERQRPLVVINRYNPKNGGLTVDRIQAFLPECDVCTLANDRAVVDSMNSGMLLRSSGKRSPMLTDMAALVDRIQPYDQADEPNQSIFRRLGRALSFT